MQREKAVRVPASKDGVGVRIAIHPNEALPKYARNEHTRFMCRFDEAGEHPRNETRLSQDLLSIGRHRRSNANIHLGKNV